MRYRAGVLVGAVGLLVMAGLAGTPVTAAPASVAPTFVPDLPDLPAPIAAAVPSAGRKAPRLRCRAWTFVPLNRTTCLRGTVDHPLVRHIGERWFAYSKHRDGWVAIPYSWSPRHRRLELDATLLRVAAPPPGRARTVWRWTCSAWTLTSETGPTDCRRGRAEQVTARLKTPGGLAWIRDPTTGRFTQGAYRWNVHGGYLTLDATAVPAAGVDLGATMSPRPSPAVSDFVVSCPQGSVTATVTARAGGRVTFDGHAVSATSSLTAPLEPGQAVRWRLMLPGQAPVDQQARCLPLDFPRWTVTGKGGRPGHWFLMTPTFPLDQGPAPLSYYVVVADSRGTPVWWRATSSYVPIDAKVLPSGALAVGETGLMWSQTSRYHTSDWSGHDGQVIGADLDLDHHELLPAKDGGYFAIRYVYRDCLGPAVDCEDMTAFGGSTSATIIDGEVVKIAPDGTVLWTWRARDHIGRDEWLDPARLDIGGHDYWDVDHINSVEEEGDGIVVSFRHLDAVYRIRLADGSIDWKLSGSTTPQSLTVAGVSGLLTVGQHDARWNRDGNLTVFDNGTFGQRPPRVLEIHVDRESRTAAVVRSVTDPRVGVSACCGSAREIEDGSWLIAWGGTPWVTEVDPSGRVVLSLRMASVFSYRAAPIPEGAATRDDLQGGMDAMHPRAS